MRKEHFNFIRIYYVIKYLCLFYNFSSKMYLYSALYYLITILSSTTSYVLLAANMEDFRMLAKQFLPDGLAEEIFKVINDTKSSKKPEIYPEFRVKRPVTNTPTESDEKEIKVKSSNQYEREEMKIKSTKRIASKYEMILEDLVEKLRNRLQVELTLMAATADSMKTTQQSNYKFNTKISTNKPPEPNHLFDIQKNNQQNHLRNLQGRYIKLSRDDTENKDRENHRFASKIKPQIWNKTYIVENHEAQQPKFVIDQSISLAPEVRDGSQTYYDKVTTNRYQMDRKIIHPKYITTITDRLGLSNIYDTSSEKSETLKHKNMEEIPYNESKKTTIHIKKKIFDDFPEYQSTTKIKDYANYEDETTNYNKKKRKSKNNSEENNYINDNTNHKPHTSSNKTLQPYLEPQQGSENVVKKGEPVVEIKELKSTTKPEDILTDHNSISKYIAPYVANLDETEPRHRKTEKVTVIPKDNGYKKSNKLKILQENNRLRKHANLHYARNTPVIIKGKVVLI